LDHQVARLHEARIRQLLRSIASGEVSPGHRLPREVDLMGQLGVSRAVVRSILQGLTDRRVIVVKHGSGQTVRPPEEWDVLDPDVLDAVIEVGDAGALLQEVVEARRVVEVPAAALAAERATTAEVVRMREHVEQMRATARSRPLPSGEDRFLEAEQAFQLAFGAATGNRPLALTLARLHHATRAARLDRGRRGDVAAERASLVAALERSDPDAARQAAADHLASVAAALEGRGRRRRR
jgi:GntR family transcriptional repressor for pyruvate dehydrogenase complex